MLNNKYSIGDTVFTVTKLIKGDNVVDSNLLVEDDCLVVNQCRVESIIFDKKRVPTYKVRFISIVDLPIVDFVSEDYIGKNLDEAKQIIQSKRLL